MSDTRPIEHGLPVAELGTAPRRQRRVLIALRFLPTGPCPRRAAP